MEELQQNIKEWVGLNFGDDFSFRPNQYETILGLCYNILNDKSHHQIVDAPTGSGKSIICIVVAGVLSKYYNKSSYILCSDLFLWKQYSDAIKRYNLPFGELQGQENYICERNNSSFTTGLCQLKRISYSDLYDYNWCESNDYMCATRCPYLLERMKAINSRVTLMTYQLWLTHMNIAKENSPFVKRDIIFCDECHKLSSIVQSFSTFFIDIDSCVQMVKELVEYAWEDSHDICVELNDEFRDIIESRDNDAMFNAIVEFSKTFKSISNIVSKAGDLYRKRSASERKMLSRDTLHIFNLTKRYDDLYQHLTMFISSIRLTNPDFIVPTIEEGRITLNCAKEDVLCNDYVLKNADYKVFLSATVGSKDAFDDNCGIKLNKNDSIIKRVDSTFDFSRSPIVFINRYKMNYNSIDENFEKVSEMCMQILKKYQNERGIIHTGSYANTVKLEEILKKSEFANRIITYENSLDKTFAINRLNELKNGILVGPTLMEGIDLPDDLCRFNIIMKVPYPNTSDKLVRAKMNIFPTWYNSETSMNIIQSIGRGVRNENDWCHTYILDACFDFLYQQTSGQYPSYVKKRIKRLK